METLLRLLEQFGLTFIPLFVAMDAVGTVPIVLNLTQRVEEPERPNMLRYAIITALGVGLGFMILGKLIFLVLGIKVADFLIAGGLILLVLATTDLLMSGREESQTYVLRDIAGVVPLGTPLIVGPAVLTTLLLLIEQHPYAMVLFSFLLNLAVAWFVFKGAGQVTRLLGTGGTRGFSKVASLLLAAIAVKMMRQGVLEILAG